MTRTAPGRLPPGDEPEDELERLRALLHDLPGMVYLEDADPRIEGPGRFLYVSPGVERVLGYTVEEWLAEPAGWVDRLHPDDVPAMRAAYQAVVPTGAPYSADYRMFAKDGRIVWIHDEAVLVRDEEGAPLYWQGVMYETVDRPATLERLQEAEQRYRALVEQTPVVTYIDPHRPDHTSAYFSPQVEALLGYTPDELTTRHAAVARAGAPGRSRTDPRRVDARREDERHLRRRVPDDREGRPHRLGARPGGADPTTSRARRSSGRACGST